jgi:colanic acid biosynthesis protein WcaH
VTLRRRALERVSSRSRVLPLLSRGSSFDIGIGARCLLALWTVDTGYGQTTCHHWRDDDGRGIGRGGIDGHRHGVNSDCQIGILLTVHVIHLKVPSYTLDQAIRGPMLGRDEYLAVVTNTPLVSIDLVIVDEEGYILVGKRTNEPALGTWFVPGGRVGKDETLDAAFDRIAEDELGPGDWSRTTARPLGVFEHFYSTNFTGSDDIGTHYVVIAYAVVSDGLRIDQLPTDQHAAFEWVKSGGVTKGGDVVTLHDYTEAYFAFLGGDSESGAVTDF